MDPEQVAIDREGVRIIRQRQRLPISHEMYDLMSFGAQTHRGPSFNLPAISTMANDVHYHKSIPGPDIIAQIINQIPSPLRDRLSRR
jgi:hypothetical protein